MDSNITFSYEYSAKENKEVEEIRKRYLPRTESKLEELRELDAKVKRPANVFAYIFGGVSALIMGSGMSLVMTEIGDILGMSDTMVPGIVIGVAGLFMAIVNYPIYSRILNSRKKKYAEEILALSDKIMNNK